MKNETNRDGVDIERLIREMEWRRRLPELHAFRFFDEVDQDRSAEQWVGDIVTHVVREVAKELPDKWYGRTVVRPDGFMQVFVKIWAWGFVSAFALIAVVIGALRLGQIQ